MRAMIWPIASALAVLWFLWWAVQFDGSQGREG